MSSLTVAPCPRCSATSVFNAATSCSFFSTGSLVGSVVVVGGVGVTVGLVLVVGGVGVTGGFVLGDGVGVFVFFGFLVFCNVTVQVSFFFPIFVCTFALPFSLCSLP
jgi:hypothetical protein